MDGYGSNGKTNGRSDRKRVETAITILGDKIATAVDIGRHGLWKGEQRGSGWNESV